MKRKHKSMMVGKAHQEETSWRSLLLVQLYEMHAACALLAFNSLPDSDLSAACPSCCS